MNNSTHEGGVVAKLRALVRSHIPLVARARARDLLRKIRGLPSADIEMWEQRAGHFGARAVFNLGHTEQELERVTELQKTKLYPLLQKQLRGGERLVIDLGCGPGRFTGDLARLTGARTVGVDPIQALLDLAPTSPNVELQRMMEGRIPVADRVADVVWICLVLGGLRDDVMHSTIAEVRRVLAPGGLVFLVENTTEAVDSTFWRFRSVADYQRALAPIQLAHMEDYDDLGERISILAGRVPPIR